MQLTRYTDYSLRVLIHLAVHREELATIEGIAGAYGISRAHLMKIVHQLGLAGYVETVRGRGGGLKLAAIGVAAGLLSAYGLTHLLASLLHNVSATDPATFAMVAGVLILVAFAACYLPARKSSRVEPLVALKYE